MLIHIGDRKTAQTRCGKPVSRRWWIEEVHVEADRGQLIACGWHFRSVTTEKDANCPDCLKADKVNP